MLTLPSVETYPKRVLLRDGAQVTLRPLDGRDKVRLFQFFERVPEDERYYLKENVTAPQVIQGWTSNIDFQRVIPIVAEVGEEIVGDATLHRSRAMARRHVGELRVVVDPAYRGVGLGRRLIRELLDIAADLGIHKVKFELVAQREELAIVAAGSMGFKEVARLKEEIRDQWGNYLDLVVLERSLKDHEVYWKF